MLNIVLIEPEIPQNTGTIGRLCLGIGANLILVGKLGFSLSEKAVRRAGLDYWKEVKATQFASIEEVIQNGNRENIFFFTAREGKIFTEAEYTKDCFLIFGCESEGFDIEVREKFKERLFYIPTNVNIRSLNLSNAVSIVAYQALIKTNLINNLSCKH